MLDSRNKPINTYVTQVSRLHNGDIAVVTSGYGIMTKKIDANACYTMKGEVEKLKFVHKILEDKQERLWIILENGKLYRKERTARLFPISQALKTLRRKISGKTRRATSILLPRMMVFTFSRQVQPPSPR